MRQLPAVLILLLALTVTGAAQEGETAGATGETPAPVTDDATLQDSADEALPGEEDDAESDDTDIDDSDLDEQTYESDDDEFVPTEEIPADEPIPFPSNI